MNATSQRFLTTAVFLLVALSPTQQFAMGLTEKDAERFRQLFNRGRRAFELEIFDVAAEAFAEAAKLDPNSRRIHTFLGRAFYRQHRYKQAEEALRRALALASEDVEARYYLARVHREQVRFDDALAEFRKIVAMEPKWQEPQFYIGEVLYKRGEYAEAQKELERALALEPVGTSPETLRSLVYTLAMSHMHLDNLAEAERSLRRVIELDPEYPRAFYSLAEVRERAGDAKEAAQLREHFDRLQRQDMERREEDARFSQHGRKGLLHLEQKKPQEAAEEFRRAIEIKASDPSLYMFLGIALTDAGRLGEAVDAHKKAVDLDPHHAMALTELGRLHAMKADFNAARDYLERAVRAQPTLLEAHELLSYVYEDTGKMEAAQRERQIAEELRRSGKGQTMYE
jgi:tetratricopeptide (TPR) repeat protein